MKNALPFSVLVLAFMLGMTLPATAQTRDQATFDDGQGEVATKIAQLCPGDITLPVGGSGVYSLEIFWGANQEVPLTGNFFEAAATSEMSLSDYATSQGTWTEQGPQMGFLEAGTLNPGESYRLSFRITGVEGGNGILTLTRGDDLQPTEMEDCPVTVVALPPNLGAVKADRVDDSNGDGVANPGEIITYTIGITNFGAGAANGVVFTDTANDHPNTMLVAGSVTTTRGLIITGNGVEDTDVRIDVGAIDGGGDQVVITFDVLIDDPFPLGVGQVVNQGHINGINFFEVLTDDVDVSGAANPTVTAVIIPRPQLVIQSITPMGLLTLDSGESVLYTITVLDDNGLPMFGALVDVDDELQGGIVTTMPTDEGGQTTYEAIVPDGTPDGRYTLSFVARAQGYADSDPVIREIDVVNLMPGLLVEPSPVDFGQVLLGNTVDRTVTISNTGLAPLTVDAVQVMGPDADDFALPSLTLPLIIAPGGSSSFMIGFMPGLRGERSADLAVMSDGGNATVPLVGEGVAPGISADPAMLDFDAVSLGSTADATFTITNTGNADLTILDLLILGADSSAFSLVSGAEPGVLAPGQTREVTVRFAPDRVGGHVARVAILNNAVDEAGNLIGNVRVFLTGEGVAPGISADPAMLDYGGVVLGSSADETFTITNTGNAELTLEPLLIVGDDAVAFSLVSGGEAGVLDPGGTREVVIRFAPQRLGAHMARVAIRNDATDAEGNPIGNVRVFLTGEGIAPGISADPAMLDFGMVTLGSTADASFLVTNTGNADLNILGVQLSGDDAAAFVIVSGGGQQVLGPGGTHEVEVRFAPERLGAHSAQVEVLNDALDDTGNPVGNVLVPLTGEGMSAAMPALDASLGAVDFGNTVFGATSAEQTVTVDNTGNVDLTLQIEVIGPDAGAFAIVQGETAGVLTPTDPPRAIGLQFTPARGGAHTASLRIQWNDFETLVALQGVGLAVSIAPPEAGAAGTGEPVEVRVAIPDGFDPTVRQLYFRRGGETTFQNVDLQDDQGGLLGMIPAASVTERGLEYYTLLANDIVTLTFPEVNPEDNPIPLRVVVESISFPVNLQPVVYRMISAPLELQDSSVRQLFDDYGAPDPTQWRAFRWRPSLEAYEEAPVDDGLGPGFGPGQAAWLITASGQGFDVEGGRSVDTAEPYVIPLPPGWSQIATPFAFPVAFSSITASGPVQGPYFYDGTEYQPNQPLLVPWEGYFVLNTGTTPVTLTVPPVEAAGVGKQAGVATLFPEAAFTVQLRAALIDHLWQDTQNYVGFAEASAAHPEVFNLAEPPPIGDHLRLSIVEDGQRYVSRFVPAGAAGHQWDLEVEAVLPHETRSTPKTVRVMLVEQGQRPEDFDLYVLDRDRGRLVPVEGGAFDVALTPDEPVRHLSIMVGTAAYAEARGEEVSQAPGAYVLEANYPNPFNPETVIRYGLPEQSAVELAVYNVLGQRVRTLVAAEQQRGQYAVMWDGLDEAGRPAPSGVYVYQLRVGGFLASRTMLLVR